MVAGTRTAEEQRAVYTLFATTHPEVIALLLRWLAPDPTSIHARTGAMWQAHHMAWIFRGGADIRETHPGGPHADPRTHG